MFENNEKNSLTILFTWEAEEVLTD